MELHPYVTFDGCCEEAFNRYKEIFGAEKFEMVMRFSDLPKNEDMEVKEEEKNNIMHMSMQIAKGYTLMGSDVPAAAKASFSPGNNTTIAVVLTDAEKAKEVFEKLAEGGKVIMAWDKQFWGSWYGKCKDKFGVDWQVDCALNEHKRQKTEDAGEANGGETTEAKAEGEGEVEAKDAAPEGEAKTEQENGA